MSDDRETLEILENQYDSDFLNNSYKEISSIDQISSINLSYNTFFNKYMRKNIPVIITNVSDQWRCEQEWITNFNINLKNLKTLIGNVKVPVANCSKEYFNSHEKIDLNFHDYLNYWNNYIERDYAISEKLYYLKDWHLRKSLPDYNFYKVPQFFGSDWLNEYLIESEKDDYMFVYMGPKNTWTPFHTDVFSSFSWSTNIIGLKKWLLLPPKEEMKLLDSLNNLPFSISEEMLDNAKIKYFVIHQSRGQALFVPSGWYHQVWNMDNTISVNHNWFNGCNIHLVWKVLRENFDLVLKEIDDCRDMEDFAKHCQIMLKASFGMNYADFVELLCFIASKRKQELQGRRNNSVFNQFNYGKNHLKFDLIAIKRILNILLIDSTVIDENIIENIHQILSQIDQIHNK